MPAVRQRAQAASDHGRERFRSSILLKNPVSATRDIQYFRRRIDVGTLPTNILALSFSEDRRTGRNAAAMNRQEAPRFQEEAWNLRNFIGATSGGSSNG
jgi:hypothetical protein